MSQQITPSKMGANSIRETEEQRFDRQVAKQVAESETVTIVYNREIRNLSPTERDNVQAGEIIFDQIVDRERVNLTPLTSFAFNQTQLTHLSQYSFFLWNTFTGHLASKATEILVDLFHERVDSPFQASIQEEFTKKHQGLQIRFREDLDGRLWESSSSPQKGRRRSSTRCDGSFFDFFQTEISLIRGVVDTASYNLGCQQAKKDAALMSKLKHLFPERGVDIDPVSGSIHKRQDLIDLGRTVGTLSRRSNTQEQEGQNFFKTLESSPRCQEIYVTALISILILGLTSDPSIEASMEKVILELIKENKKLKEEESAQAREELLKEEARINERRHKKTKSHQERSPHEATPNSALDQEEVEVECVSTEVLKQSRLRIDPHFASRPGVREVPAKKKCGKNSQKQVFLDCLKTPAQSPGILLSPTQHVSRWVGLTSLEQIKSFRRDLYGSMQTEQLKETLLRHHCGPWLLKLLPDSKFQECYCASLADPTPDSNRSLLCKVRLNDEFTIMTIVIDPNGGLKHAFIHPFSEISHLRGTRAAAMQALLGEEDGEIDSAAATAKTPLTAEAGTPHKKKSASSQSRFIISELPHEGEGPPVIQVQTWIPLLGAEAQTILLYPLSS